MYENILKELRKLEDLIELALEVTLKEDKVYKPTEGMATAAKRALKWHEEGKPGGTIVGFTRANQLKNRENPQPSS